MNKLLKRLGKITLWTAAGILLLVIILLILLQTAFFQQFLTGKLASYLSNKLKTEVTIGAIRIGFPRTIILHDFYIEDQKKDTLAYVHELGVDINMIDAIFHKKISLNQINLNTATINVNRNLPDSLYNFDFILKAFASTNPTPNKPDTTSSSYNILIGNISLENIYATYHDEPAGNDATAKVGSLNLQFNPFDLNQKKIFLQSFEWKNSSVSFNQSKISPADTTPSSPFDYDVQAKKIALSDVNLQYANSATQMKAGATVHDLNLDVKKIDLKKQLAEVQSLELGNNSYYFQYAADTSQKTSTTDTSRGWRIVADNVKIDKNSFKYDNVSAPALKEGIDYNHLQIDSLSTEIKNISYSSDSTSANLQSLHALEKSGLALHSFKANFRMTSTKIVLSDFLLQDGQTQLSKNISVSYPSLEAISRDPNKVFINADLQNSSLAVKDALLFMPSLKKNKYVAPNVNRTFNLNAQLQGTLNNLQIKNLNVFTAPKTTLVANGTIKGLPDIGKTVFNIQLNNFSSGNSELHALLPDSTLPAQIVIPDQFSLSGNFNGRINDFHTVANLKSSIGNANLTASLRRLGVDTNYAYDISVKADQFDLGRLLDNDSTFGIVSASASAKGEGFDVNTMNTIVSANVQNAFLNQYNYQNAALDGKIDSGSFNGTIRVADPNLDFDFNGLIGIDLKKPLYEFTADIKNIDLYALHFASSPFSISAQIQSNIEGKDFYNMNGEMAITAPTLEKNGTTYQPGDAKLVAASANDSFHIQFTSAIADAAYQGTIPVTTGFAELMNHVNYYFDKASFSARDTTKHGHFMVAVDVDDEHDFLPQFFPGLTLEPFKMDIAFDAEKKILQLHSASRRIQYDNVDIDTLFIDATSDQNQLNYSMGSNRITYENNYIELERPRVHGYLRNDSLDINIQTGEDVKKPDFSISADAIEADSLYKIHLKNDLIFNKVNWSVDSENFIHVGNQGLFIRDLKITNGDKYLVANNQGNDFTSPLEIAFKNFDLANLISIIDSSQHIVDGNLNGQVQLKLNGPFSFTSDLELDSFKVKSQPMGTLQAKVDNSQPDQYNVDVKLEGEGNQAAINGFYKTGDQPEINLHAKLDSLKLVLIEPFSLGYLKRTHGDLSGNLQMNGSISGPRITGNLYLNGAGFTPTATNVPITFGAEPIAFDDAGIQFKNLTIQDTAADKATINGGILTSDYKDYKLNLDFKCENFMVINIASSPDKTYYGTLRVDNQTSLSGSLDNLSVNTKIKLRSGTDLTYARSTIDTAINSAEGIVEFVSAKSPDGMHVKKDTVLPKPVTKNYSINATLITDTTSKLTLIVDQQSGDQLIMRTAGTLNFDMNQSGKMSLTGRLDLYGDRYKMTLLTFSKKEFAINRGSYIVWTGDPMKAEVSIVATEAVSAAPLNLMQAQLSNASDAELTQYKQKLTFLVQIVINGQILQPDIHFALDMAEGDRGYLGGTIYSRILQINNSESELNQQVFSLLAFGSFLPQDPFGGSAYSTSTSQQITSLVQSSASSILTNALNSLATNYVKGIDLNFDYKSYTDYSTGEAENRNVLNVAISKSLFNDRVKVTVGQDFNLSGGATPIASQSGNNISLQYLLTQDGRLSLRFFRQNSYQGLFEGQVEEEGGSLVYGRDFNKLSNLFKGTRK